MRSGLSFVSRFRNSLCPVSSFVTENCSDVGRTATSRRLLETSIPMFNVRASHGSLTQTTPAPPNLVMRAASRSCRCSGSSNVYGTAIHASLRCRATKGFSVCRAVVFFASGRTFSTRLTSFQSPPPRPHLGTTATGSLRSGEGHTRVSRHDPVTSARPNCYEVTLSSGAMTFLVKIRAP